MPDEVDDLILKMQHLEAQARESQTARSLGDRGARWKSRAQEMAAGAQDELAAAEKEQAAGEASVQRAHAAGLATLEAADLLIEGKRQAQEGKTRAIKARARLDFALAQMDEAERQEWQALQADARADAHGQLARSGDDSARAPAGPAAAEMAGGGSGAEGAR
jgi:hypothetical protein